MDKIKKVCPETWDIYTKDRVKTGRTIARGEKLSQDDYHLVVHIWIQNQNNEFLIQKRAPHLSWMPNIWASTGGAVIKDEDSLQGVIRETKEELGIELTKNDIHLLFTEIRGQDISDIYLSKGYFKINDFTFQKEDMSEIKFVNEFEIRQMIKSGEFVDYGSYYFSHFNI